MKIQAQSVINLYEEKYCKNKYIEGIDLMEEKQKNKSIDEKADNIKREVENGR